MWCRGAESIAHHRAQERGSPETDTQPSAPKHIEDALLTINEMPSGWSSAPAEKGSDAGLCGAKASNTTDPIDQAKAMFVGNPTISVPQVQHVIARFEPGEAEVRFDEFLKLANDCQSFVQDGQKVVASDLSFAKVGDDSIALRYVVENEAGLSAIADFVLWRRGDVAMFLSYASLGPDPVAVKQLVNKADAKLQKL